MEKAIKNEVITDRKTERPTDIVNYRVVCTRLKIMIKQFKKPALAQKQETLVFHGA